MAKINRVSKKVIAGVTAEEFKYSLAVYAEVDAKKDKMTAKMDEEITRIREKYAGDLDDYRKAQEEAFGNIEAYCRENKPTLFNDKRSFVTLHGTVGFRLGTPKLKTLPKWTWEKVLDTLRTVMPEYLRKYEEVDKEAIIRDRMDEQVAPHLNAAGIYVAQDEHFFIELKKEE